MYYPSSFIAIIFIWVLPETYFTRDPVDLTIVGLLLVIPAFLHVLKLDQKFGIERKFSSFSRIMLGIGFGYFVRYLFSVPWGYALLGFIFAFSFFIFINIMRLRNFWNDCDGCPYVEERQNYGNCPGLNPFNSFLNPNIIQNFEIVDKDKTE